MNYEDLKIYMNVEFGFHPDEPFNNMETIVHYARRNLDPNQYRLFCGSMIMNFAKYIDENNRPESE